MSATRLYAVFDLKGGQVVHAVAGKREQYGPLRSQLTNSTEAGAIARAVTARWGIDHAYIADLDAIAGRSNDYAAIDAILNAGMRVVLDVGIGTVAQAELVLRRWGQREALRGIVVPLECTCDERGWSQLVNLIGAGRAVFSLDLMAGRPMVRAHEAASETPEEIARRAWHAGFRRLIVLDLQTIGTAAGPSTVELCRRLSEQHPWSEILSGGGVRSRDDIDRLELAGCHSVLIGTALHGQAEGRRLEAGGRG